MTVSADVEARRREVQQRLLEAAERAMGPHVVTLASDFTFVLLPSPSLTMHVAFPAAESPVPMDWEGGEMVGKHKLTGKGMARTLHRGKGIAMLDHDCGPAIVHIVLASVPITIASLSTLATMFSSRKCMFGAAKVLLERKGNVGACTLTNIPPTPMLVCSDPVPLPGVCAPQSHSNTLRFKMTWADYVLGLLAIGTEQVISIIASKVAGFVFGGGKQAAAEGVRKAVAQALSPTEAVVDFVGGSVAMLPVKSVLISALKLGEVAVLGEPAQRTSLTPVDVQFWSYSIEFEKTENGLEIVPTDDPGASGGDPDGEVL